MAFITFYYKYRNCALHRKLPATNVTW